jgi:hypothetical protein
MPGGADHRPAFDYSGDLAAFRSVAGVPALVPHALPASWRANGAQLFDPTPGVHQVHVGWATPGERFAGLDEATGDPAALVARTLGARGVTVSGTVTAAGVTWQRRVSDRGEPALTRRAGAVTAVITGNATDQQLLTLAASLR